MQKSIEGAVVNGIDVGALHEFVGQVEANPTSGAITFDAVTTWEGGARTRTETSIVLGDKLLPRNFVINADEPQELLGTNSAANPQELILAALNACVTATYAANAAAMGIELKSLVIRSKGNLDLRGFLGIDSKVNPGYDQVEYEVEIESSASSEALNQLHSKVQEVSPNHQNFARAINLKTQLIIRN